MCWIILTQHIWLLHFLSFSNIEVAPIIKLLRIEDNDLHILDSLPMGGDLRTWGRLNIKKMSSYQYRDPRVKDKTVSRPSNL